MSIVHYKNEIVQLKTHVKNGKTITVHRRKQKSYEDVSLKLHKEIKNGDTAKIVMFIHQGHNVNQPFSDTWTPLHLAAYHGYRNIIKILIQNNAEINPIIRKSKLMGFTPIHLAVLKNHYECVELLLQYGAANYNPKIEYTCHPIHIAVAKNNMEIANLLLDYGVNINLRFSDDFFFLFNHNMKESLWEYDDLPLIQFSILKKQNEMTDLLLRRGADINLKSNSKKTSLMQAVQVNDIELVKYLVIEKSANVNDCDHKERSVLTLTLNNELLLSFKESFDLRHQNLQIIRFLVEAGANVNHSYMWYDITILDCAVGYGLSEIVEFLLFESNFDYQKITSRVICEVGGKIPRVICDGTPFVHNELVNILLTILRFLISKRLLGWPVHQDLFNCILNHHLMRNEDISNSISNLQVEIMDIINVMKLTKIGNSNITYWNFSTCGIDKLAKFTACEDVKNLDMSYCKSNFYTFWYVMKSRLSLGIEQRLCFEKSIEAIFKLSQNHLPYDCCEKIASLFTFNELELLVMNFNSID